MSEDIPAYFYMPLPEGVEKIEYSPTELDPDSFKVPEGLVKYNPELIKEGEKYYSKITIDTFEEPNPT
jgi:hypothetical protein